MGNIVALEHYIKGLTDTIERQYQLLIKELETVSNMISNVPPDALEKYLNERLDILRNDETYPYETKRD